MNVFLALAVPWVVMTCGVQRGEAYVLSTDGLVGGLVPAGRSILHT